MLNNESIVSFKVAKLLKKLNYNEPVINAYTEEGKLLSMKWDDPHNYNSESCLYSAPYQCEVFTYLRDAYNIHILIDFYASETNSKAIYYSYTIYNENLDPITEVKNKDFVYKSYEDAMDKAMYEAVWYILNKK